MKCIDITEWLIKMKPYYLTVNDVLKFKKNEVIKILCIDRNFHDLCDEQNNIPSKPEYFFRNNYQIEYRHKYGVNGDTKWLGISNNILPFTFEINYNKKNWYPLSKAGKLPISVSNETLDFSKYPLYWKEYPTNTLLGWRGPMVKWDDIINRNYLIRKTITSQNIVPRF